MVIMIGVYFFIGKSKFIFKTWRYTYLLLTVGSLSDFLSVFFYRVLRWAKASYNTFQELLLRKTL